MKTYDNHVERIIRAKIIAEEAKREVDEAVLDMYCDGHSFADIAKALGCSRQNIVRKYGPMVETQVIRSRKNE